MRIRKQASKLLGYWASCSLFPSSASPPPAPPLIQSPDANASELQCQLNLSPWDAIESPQCTNSQEAKSKVMNEEQTSVVGNGVEAKEEEEAEEENVEKREQEAEACGSGAMIKCKKTDGWHCKRLAQNPHSLCSYHLTQLRSYRPRFEDQISGDHRRKSAVSMDYGGAVSNYYYYYSILGPWWVSAEVLSTKVWIGMRIAVERVLMMKLLLMVIMVAQMKKKTMMTMMMVRAAVTSPLKERRRRGSSRGEGGNQSRLAL